VYEVPYCPADYTEVRWTLGRLALLQALEACRAAGHLIRFAGDVNLAGRLCGADRTTMRAGGGEDITKFPIGWLLVTVATGCLNLEQLSPACQRRC
jgi:hypothetical protein